MATRNFIHRLITGAAALVTLYFAFSLTFGEGGLLDPSLPTDYTIRENLPGGTAPANLGAFEGGETGTEEDAGINNVIQKNGQADGDIPTGAPPSKLFGAKPFTQRMLRFEEFGRQPLPESYDEGDPFPAPQDAESFVAGKDLDNFLAQDLYPEPTRLSNDVDENPWRDEIEVLSGTPRRGELRRRQGPR